VVTQQKSTMTKKCDAAHVLFVKEDCPKTTRAFKKITSVPNLNRREEISLAEWR
jgi:hypothetical protein